MLQNQLLQRFPGVWQLGGGWRSTAAPSPAAAPLIPWCQGSATALALLMLPPAQQSALPTGTPVLTVAVGIPLQLGSVRSLL